MKENFEVIIIGAGLSGLLTGALLSEYGKKVCIVEKNSEIGGAVQPFKRKDVYFDTGMNFIGAADEGQIQRQLFKIIGTDKLMKLTKRENNVFRVRIKDRIYMLPGGFENYEQALIGYFPNEENAIRTYIKKIFEIYSEVSLQRIFDRDFNYSYYQIGAFDFIQSITDNKELQNLLCFNNLLYGSDKESVSLYLHAVITASYIDSCYEFTFGVNEFINELKNKIANTGGKIFTDKKITSLNSENGKVVSCSTEDGTLFCADNFISTLHPAITLSLTNSNHIKKFYRNRINSLSNSPGAFLIWFKLKDSVLPFRDEIMFVFEEDSVWDSELQESRNFMFYTPFSGKKGAFAGTVKVMKYMSFEEVEQWKETDSGKRGEEYTEFKERKVKEVVIKLNELIPGFEKYIDTYYTSTPLTYLSYTGIPGGSMYGIVHDYRRYSETALSVRTKLSNLFLTGQNIYFHGLLGVSITSLLTSSYLIKNINLDFKNI